MKPEYTVLPVELRKSKRVIHAVVIQPGSPGKQEGYDLAFRVCSEKCASILKSTVEEEATGFKLLN